MRVKDVDDWDENWLTNLPCQLARACENWRLIIVTEANQLIAKECEQVLYIRFRNKRYTYTYMGLMNYDHKDHGSVVLDKINYQICRSRQFLYSTMSNPSFLQ